MQFPGFTEADFDAYRPERATSHAFNRPRLEVKQKALALGRELLQRALVGGTPLEVRASDEHPSLANGRSVTTQWVSLWRDTAQRAHLDEVLGARRGLGTALTDPTPSVRHPYLGVHLDAARVQVTFRLHGDARVDVRTLAAVCEDPSQRAALLACLRGLPVGFLVGLIGAPQVSAETLDDAALASVPASLAGDGSAWQVSLAVERTEAVGLGASLADRITQAFDALLPVYRIIAWSPDNDRIAVDQDIQKARADRDAHVSEVAAREASWRAEHDAEIHRRREAAVVEARERAANLEPARPAAVHAAVQTVLRQVDAAAQARATPPRPAAPSPRAVPRAATDGGKPVAPTTPPARGAVASGAVPPRDPARRDAPRRDAPRRDPPRREPQGSGTEGPRAAKSSVDPSGAAPATGAREDTPREAPAPRVRSTVLVESEVPVALGAQVRVRTGPFAGRVGMVTALDGRGHVKVAFGQLTARLVTEEVVTLAEV